MIKWIKYWCGLILLGIGVSMVINANFGSDPISTIMLGISNITKTSFGVASQIFLISLIIIVLLIDKKRLRIGTVIHALINGSIIGFFLEFSIFNTSLLLRIASLVFGTVILSFGIAFYISADLGEGALDSLMMALHDKFKLKINIVRIVLDSSMVICGVIMGAKFNIGSIFVIVATGPCIQFSLSLISKFEEMIFTKNIRI
ncbi:MAG: hypothetical protein N4A50_14985 [Vallitalea sp.]|jgi:uncharacterized membrane protein YczE|nr:hypothetical protein [Vallitalea sp.]